MLQAVQYLPIPDTPSIEGAVSRLAADGRSQALLAFVPEAEAAAIPVLQAACRKAGARLFGALFPQIIAGNRLTDAGIVIGKLSQVAYAGIWEGLNNPYAAAEQTEGFLLATADILNGDSALTLLLLFDGMLPNIGSMLDDLYLRLADRVSYVGANAGSESFQPTPCLFDNERLVGNGALALILKTASTPILEHGYALPENQIVATSTAGNRIAQIDWQPAFEVYRRVVREQYGTEITRDNFYLWSVHFPFGIVLADGEIIVRIPVQLAEDGSICCVGEIPPNALLTLLPASDESDFHTARRIRSRLAGLENQAPTLAFYCAGRRLHLGPEKSQQELEELAGSGEGSTFFGALTIGEVGCPADTAYPLFHNATIVVVPSTP